MSYSTLWLIATITPRFISSLITSTGVDRSSSPSSRTVIVRGSLTTLAPSDPLVSALMQQAPPEGLQRNVSAPRGPPAKSSR